MKEAQKKAQTEPNAVQSDEFNRTVVIVKPEYPGKESRIPFHRITRHFTRKKLELEDLIGSTDFSHYTTAEPDTSAALSIPLNKLEDRYAVLEKVASGGLATVSIARDRNLQRIVAIKSLKQETGHGGLIDSFISEAKVTAQLDHPAIIPIYGLAGDRETGIHLSMKLINGRTLRDHLRNIVTNYRVRGIHQFDETAQLRKRLELFLRVCDAIAYAHHRNIMHRDLKPENIMLGEYMEVYVVDWGLAKVIPKEGEPHECSKKISGTPRYFSPEALRGERCDARSDIFTLGLILQEIVTLQFAVRGKNEKELLERIFCGELEPIRHLFKWRIDKPLRAIIRKASAYQPEDRYQSAAELAEDLRRYMAGLSISAVPENLFTKISRCAYRYRKEFFAGTMTLLFGFAAVSAYSIYRQLEISREMNVQESAVNFIYNRTATVSEHLDITALHIQEQLSALSRITAYLLAYNEKSGNDLWVRFFRPASDQTGTPETGTYYSPYYKRLISFDYGICSLAPDSVPAENMEFIRKVYPVLTKMKNIVLGSRTVSGPSEKNREQLQTEYLFQGGPVRSVFIGSSGGVKLLYPWRGNRFRKIDPRKREWYRNAQRKRGPVWGKPYMDFDSISGLSIPCSVPIYDLNGKFRGVAGLDLSVNKLTSRILGKGNTGNYVIEKAVINQEGETIFSSKSEYFNRKFDPDQYHHSTEFKTPLFRTPEIRSRILGKDKGYGTFLISGEGREIIYSFAHLDVLNMYFVVVADYGKLKEYIASRNL